MKIIDFKQEHVEQARKLAILNYNEEREQVAILPDEYDFPNLEHFAKNGLGVAAFENDKMIGFLCCYQPFDNAFNSLATGVFSPIHAHGTIKENREKIYKRMYQAAAEKWVKHKIGYHAIACYAHDKDAINALYTYGFGLRCIDAIRPMQCIENIKEIENITYQEIKRDEMSQVRTLRKILSDHFANSPCFMYSTEEQFNESLAEHESSDHRVFVAKDGDKTIAFLEISDEAENFVTDVPEMKNICGACCLPEYRGQNIVQNLMNYMITKLQKEKYIRLGVDYESINPTASVFWAKYFQMYTNSLVRRIDECAFHD